MDDNNEPIEMGAMTGDELVDKLQEEPRGLEPLGALSRSDLNEPVDETTIEEFRERLQNDREELVRDLILHNDGSLVSMEEYAERLHARTGIVLADSDNHGLTFQYPRNAGPSAYGLERDNLPLDCSQRIILDIHPDDTPEPLTQPADDFF